VIRSLAPLIDLLLLAWYRRALKEMGGDHPDAPEVVLLINALENKP
jgi:hypothetical protein